MARRILTSLLPFLTITPTLSTPTPKHTLPLPARTVAQLASSPSWLENIAVRANGDLLVTQLVPAPVLYTVRNPSAPHAALEPLYTWHEPNVTILLGIIETYPDVFAVIAGNATANATGYPGTFSAWEVDFSASSPKTVPATPAVRKIANIPAATFLNGVIPLPGNPSVLLIPDSQFGLIFRLDTRTGASEVIADRPEFKPYPERQNKTVGFGINGVRILDRYLYFTNSNLVSIFRLKITRDGYVARNGKAGVELVADLNAVTTFVDDFAVGEDGTLWAVSNDGNTIVAVSRGGRRIESVAGQRDQLTVAGGTAAAFGRGKKDRKVLYVSTAGGLDAPVNGTVTEPGKVVAVDTEGYTC